VPMKRIRLTAHFWQTPTFVSCLASGGQKRLGFAREG
jgi:hypothetical protein